MNLDKINRWVAVIANIGVVIGLFALIAELNHASKLSETAAYQSRMSERQSVSMEIAANEELAALLEKYESEGIGSLTSTELRRVRSFENGVIVRLHGQYYQYQQGFLDRSSIDSALNNMTLRYPRWQELGLIDSFENVELKSEILSRLRI